MKLWTTKSDRTLSSSANNGTSLTTNYHGRCAREPRARRVWGLLLLVMLSASKAKAQDQKQPDLGGMTIEDLAKVQVESVYGASKFLQNASDAPTSVTVVTAEDIQKYGYRTLADVLQTVRGFYVINDRNYSYVGVRGFLNPRDYNARILFLVDGHRINDNIFDGSYVGTEFPVDVDLIERIEIIRGPNSSIYGTGAFAAVINVITKRGRDMNAAEISAAAGSWNSYKGRVSYGNRFDDGVETLLAGSFYNSGGHESLFFPAFNSPATNNGFAVNADGDQSYNAFADVIYRDFDIHFVQGSRTKHIPTAPFGTVFDDPRTRTTDARGYVDLQYHHTFGSWETLARISYDWYDYHGIYIYDYAGTGIPPYTQNYDAADGTWWDFQGDTSKVFFKRHKVTLGMEYRQDLSQQQVNYDIQPFHQYVDDHRSSRIWALYFQDEYRVGKELAFVVGLRSDWHEKFKTTLSPRAGLLFTPQSSTDIKAIYSWAFRDPNSYENFYGADSSSPDSSSLKPELIRSWELDVEHRFGKTYYVSGAGFLNRIDELIVQGFDPATGNPSFSNSSPVQTKGFELELGAKWTNGAKGVISDSVQDSSNVVTTNALTNSPRHLAKMNLSVPLARTKFFAAVDAQYVSRRTTVAETVLGGYFVMNATFFTRQLNDRFEISGGLYNLFDRRYSESASIDEVETSIPQDGRNFRIKLTYRSRFNGR